MNGLILPRWAIHIWLHWKYYLRCGLVPGVMYGCFQVLCRAENSNQNNLCSLQRRGHEATTRLLVVKSATAVITTGIFQKGEAWLKLKCHKVKVHKGQLCNDPFNQKKTSPSFLEAWGFFVGLCFFFGLVSFLSEIFKAKEISIYLVYLEAFDFSLCDEVTGFSLKKNK